MRQKNGLPSIFESALISFDIGLTTHADGPGLRQAADVSVRRQVDKLK
jgi:hypothetical protein